MSSPVQKLVANILAEEQVSATLKHYSSYNELYFQTEDMRKSEDELSKKLSNITEIKKVMPWEELRNRGNFI